MSDAIMISVSSRAPGSGLLNTYRPTTSTKVQTIRQKRIVAANPHTTFSMRWRGAADCPPAAGRSEEHTSELQSLMRISYAVFCFKNKLILTTIYTNNNHYSTQH